MSQVVATVTSAAAPIDGNEHNSSENFQFLELPASGNLSIQISDNANADSITFSLWHEKTAWPDSEVASGLANGAQLPVSDVELNTDYYIGDPSNAGGDTFVVSFLAS